MHATSAGTARSLFRTMALNYVTIDGMKDLSDQPLPSLPLREKHGHKRNYGRVLLVGGSLGMAGSISLSSLAALRSGAGLVTVATPRCIQSTVAGFAIEYMTVGLDDHQGQLAPTAAESLKHLAEQVDITAIGPGLGRSSAITEIVQELYASVRAPMVVDADGLNAIAERPQVLASPGGPRVLTPHPGEYARLTGQGASDRPSTRAKAAIHLATRDKTQQTTVVLKGAGTVVANPKQVAFNITGNPGMATGGTGDVLTGIVAALAAQGLEPWDAARLGVHLHGLAGDLAAEELGQVSLVASDLIDWLPTAFLATQDA